MGSADIKEGELLIVPPHLRTIPAYYLDTMEVSVQAFNDALKGDDKRRMRMAGQPDYPVAGILWDQAAAWAEIQGKRLPDEAEYEYAATACGKHRYPWGENQPDPLPARKWTFGPVGHPAYDCLRLPNQPPVMGLYSNVVEWTSNWVGSYPGPALTEAKPEVRVIRGGPNSVAHGQGEFSELFGPRERFGLLMVLKKEGVGFRCARSARPRWNAEDFGRVLHQDK
jgi:formylglycine-generating enzyme required for sulfatase activity